MNVLTINLFLSINTLAKQPLAPYLCARKST